MGSEMCIRDRISNFPGEETIDSRNEENSVKNRDEVRPLVEDGGGR